jgi:hypothetical protein
MKIAVFWVTDEAARTSETLVNFYQTTRCYNPEDSNLQFKIYFTVGSKSFRTVCISFTENISLFLSLSLFTSNLFIAY